MGKIVYHGTFSEAAPHEWLQETFHAGTLLAADERGYDQISGGDVEYPSIRRTHAYEISDTAPMSRREWSDPDIKMAEKVSKTAPPVVPEHKTNRIYPYQNAREDYGSTSYVIPSEFVGKHVKHLGVQFQDFYGLPEQHTALMKGITSMSGGGK